MQLDEHFQRRLNEARMFFAEGKALAAEKIYRDLLKPDLPAGGRVLVLDGLGRCLHIQGLDLLGLLSKPYQLPLDELQIH